MLSRFLCFCVIILCTIDLSTCDCENLKDPTIVWWTDRLYPHFDADQETIRCEKGKCKSIKKKKFKRNENLFGFLFYGTDFEAEDVPLPRHKSDLWALLHEESPMNNYLFSHTLGIRLFNYTSTFRRGSDYPLITQFIPNLDYITKREPYPLKDKNRLRQNGLSPVLYVQSHCAVASDRDRYVKELSKYIHIDCYGKCLHNKDLPKNLSTTDQYESEEFLEFISRYKFHLAFENAICEDYMTEKLFRALHVGSIPVYKGSSKVIDWVPNDHSVIVVDDFESPKHLADYLLMLDSSDEHYSLYLEYKTSKEIKNNILSKEMENREWGVNEIDKIDFILGFECYFCNRMIELTKNACECNSIADCLFVKPKMANKTHMGCPQPHPSVKAEVQPNDEWIQQAWVDSYWYGLDVAEALHKMIYSGETKSHRLHKYLLSLKYAH